jgi:hypothetical protein
LIARDLVRCRQAGNRTRKRFANIPSARELSCRPERRGNFMKKTTRLSLRGGGRNSLDLQRRAAEGLKVETRGAEVVQVVDNPRMLARRHFDNGRNQEALTWSISLDNLPHKELEKNPLRGCPGIQQDKPLIAFENEVTIPNHAHEAESVDLRGLPRSFGPGRRGFLLQGNDLLRWLRYEGRRDPHRLQSALYMSLRPDQRTSRRIEDSPPNRLRLPEAHLELSWMDVAIDKVEVHLDVKHANGMLAPLKNPRIRLAK